MEHPSVFHKEIERWAYQSWEERGRPWGTPDVDWFKAEEELSRLKATSGVKSLAREVGSAIGNLVAFLKAIIGARIEQGHG
jgi:hypothetical protein